MFSRLREILTNSDIREWIIWRASHSDTQHQKMTHTTPPYLVAPLELNSPKDFSLGHLPRLGPVSFKGQSTPTLVVQLASKEVKLHSPGELFTLTFDDIEDSESIHRFGWLIRILESHSNSASLFEKEIVEWIKKYSEAKSGSAWAPYTVGERLSNWGLFLCRTRCFEKWTQDGRTQFINSVYEQARFLVDNLEYHGEYLTGNHLSNNGRGLLWAALILQDIKLANIAHKIVYEESRRLIQNDGMLREGSAHYQFICTRNYVECFWLSSQFNFGDQKEYFRELLKKMVQSCRFLRIQGQIPPIGDLSPDAPPEWFIHVPEAADQIIDEKPAEGPGIVAQGWASHFFEKVYPLGPGTSSGLNAVVHAVRDDFYRMENTNYTLFFHVNREGHPRLAGHGHRDTGCPLVYVKGKSLLTERGRKNYKSESRAALGTHYHNGILIDGKEIEFSPRGIYGPKYLKNRSFKDIACKTSSGTLELKFSGFSKKCRSLIRRYKVDLDSVKLEFEVQGKGKSHITLFIHSPQSAVPLTWPENGVLTKESTSRSTAYGSAEPCFTWTWQTQVDLPWTGAIVLGKIEL